MCCIKDGIYSFSVLFIHFGMFLRKREKKSIQSLLPVLVISDDLLNLEIFMAEFIKFIVLSIKRQFQPP